MEIVILSASWARGYKSNRPPAFSQVPHIYEPIISEQHSKSGFGTSILGPYPLTLLDTQQLKNKVSRPRFGETRLLC